MHYSFQFRIIQEATMPNAGDTNQQRDLGSRLEAYRVARGLSQSSLAGMLETSQPTLSRILSNKGNPRPQLRERVLTLLAVGAPAEGAEEWISLIIKAAEISPAFRAIVEGGLRLVNANE
jgi:transcriptional regulator with XRE-family HTH domain